MEQPPPFPPAVEPIPETPAAPPMSLGGRLFNMYATPGEVFEDIRLRPPAVANWLVPALIAIVVGWIGSWLIFSQDAVLHQLSEMAEQGVQKQIERMNASPEQAEQMREAAAKYGAIGQRVGGFLMPPIAALGTPFMWGLLLWLASKGLRSQVAYMKMVEVVGLSSMIGILDGIIRTLMIVALGNLWAGPHAGMLVPGFDPQNSLHGVLAALSVMTFWILGVRAIGLARLTGSSFTKAALWVFGIWAGYTALFTGIGLALKKVFGG